MLHEFAVEPEALSQFNAVWQALEQFGVQHGRMICEFPKRWRKLVYEATNGCNPAERSRLEERLRRLTEKLLPSGRPFDPNMSWQENARLQQQQRPFRAIIQRDNPDAAPDVLTDADLHGGNPHWSVPSQKRCPRSVNGLAECAASLGRCSREILFVDPHFSTDRRWIDVLIATLKASEAADGHFRRIEIHTGTEATKEYLQTESLRRIAPNLPTGIAIKFRLWNKIAGGEKMHARYVLTERGGIRFDVGLDTGEPGETTDVSLLSNDLYEVRWREFQDGTFAFQLRDEFVLQCSGS